jgi:AcrR family transcriptional regulator
MEESTLGRREENKLRTRSALERAAARLFEEQGFSATTVRDIAAAAGVGERTFFRYFPSKEDLVLDEVRRLIPSVMRLVRERPAEEPLFTAFCEAMVDWLTATNTAPAILISGPPKNDALHVASVWALENDLEDALTEAFLDRLEAAGADRGDRLSVLRATVQARAGVSAVRGMVIASNGERCDGPAMSSESGRAPSVDELKDQLREAFSMLEP